MFEFHLHYQGLLLSSGNSGRSDHKQDVRRYFHDQLANLWKLKYPLKYKAEHLNNLATDFRMGDKKFIPIATHDNFLACGLDVTLLSRDFRGVMDSGDLDGRLKTIIDALRIPKAGENSDGPENPLLCVMEDDGLISELRVTGDLLLAQPEQLVHSPKISLFTGDPTIKESHALVLVRVTMKATRRTAISDEFP